VANRITKQFDQKADQTIEDLIIKTLDRLVAIS
jgi:hypothetical protein